MPLIDRDAPEISDLIVDFHPETLERLNVSKDEVIDRFLEIGRRKAARIVRAIPERDGYLDPDAVDDMLVTAHYELQGLSEEFAHGQRVSELLVAFLAALRSQGAPAPLRVVDIGCGTGFVIRWLAAFGELGDDVELVGADYNLTLVGEARRLAALEDLRCKFVAANAFKLDEPAAVYLSTGTIHHFRGGSLADFFTQHDNAATAAFAHFDFQPTFISPIGAWLFHAIRMRQPMSRYDGYWSAVRAHPGEVLTAAVQDGAPDFHRAIYGARIGPFPRVFHTLVGVRPHVRDAFVEALGDRTRRLGEWKP